MSHFIASIHAYDVMDHIYISAEVRDVDRQGDGASTSVLHLSTTISGAGVSTPRQWLQDALVGLLEEL